MNEHSRRTFLITTGATAAVGAVAVSAPGAAASSATQAQKASAGQQIEPGAPVVAYVSDVASGQVTVMRGEDEVVLTDHDLARRLTGEVR
ncbi:hypothetical protein ACPPVT_14655 [Angustibacter sp. McL0619]|uniref:hypothetical protein n=1 Tax=Angustibacter sp. McL0619 TaxID=3415676 RepID=UPI003CEEE660